MTGRSRTGNAPLRELKQAPNEQADALVLVSKAVVATAIGVGIWRQFGLPPALAALVGLSLFAGLVGLFVMRSGSRREQLLASQIDRLKGEAGRAATTVSKIAPPVAEQSPPLQAESSPQPSVPPNAGPRAASPSAPRHPESQLSNSPGRVPPTVRVPIPIPVFADPELMAPPAPRPPDPASVPAELFADGAHFNGVPELPREAAETTLMQPYWSFRPTEPHVSAPTPGVDAMEPWHLSADPAFGPTPPLNEVMLPAPSPRDAEVEMIQGLIKKMADEVNAAEAQQRAGEKAGVAGDRDADDRLIGASLDALRFTVDAMRTSHRTVPVKPEAQQRVEPSFSSAPEAAPRSPRATALAEAISTGNVDVFLDPIMALGEKSARHYEVSIRVRGQDGREIAGDGMEIELRGSGLLPLVDEARIARASIIAGRLSERGKNGSLFSSTSGETLADSRFMATAGADLRRQPAQARHLVLTFSQHDIRHLAPAQWRGLTELQDLGLRFALDGVTNLDMDFGALAGAGFGFVKLRADVFLDGLPSSGGTIPASDICRHLAGAGMALIVEDIDDEAKLARIFGFGVALGQGSLFGGRRPVKAEAVAVDRGQAAA